MLETQETTYIYPPRATTSLPRNDHTLITQLKWWSQYKYNDTRILIKLRKNGTIELWNRHAERLRSYNPPIPLQDQLETLKNHLQGYCLLDGGLLHSKHEAIKNTIIIWDILVNNGQHQLNTTYAHRYTQLQPLLNGNHYNYKPNTTVFNLGKQITPDILIPHNIQPQNIPNSWELIDKINHPHLTKGSGPLIEGLVYKDPNGTLEPGHNPKNNQTWMCRSRIQTKRHLF